MAKGTFYTQVYAITSLIVVVFFLSDFIWFIVLLNTAITYTLEVCVTSRLSSARLSSTHRTIHALPLDYTAKTLRELEADGRATFSITAPSEAQLPPPPLQSSAWRNEEQQSGRETGQKNEQQQNTIAGVSFACLQMFASENNIAPGMTLAQVCARIIKPKTSFNPRQTELPALDRQLEVRTHRNSVIQKLEKRLTSLRKESRSTTKNGASGSNLVYVEDLEAIVEGKEGQAEERGVAEGSSIEANARDDAPQPPPARN